MIQRTQPTPEEVERQMAPGMINKLLEQAPSMLRREIPQLMPLLKPAQLADMVSAVILVAKNGGQRDVKSLEPITSKLDSYVAQHSLSHTERERLLGELVARYRRVLQLLYSGMEIFFEGWPQRKIAEGWEATDIAHTEVVKNEAGELTGVTVNVEHPAAH